MFCFDFFICNIGTSIKLVQTNNLPLRTYCSLYHSLLDDSHFFTGTYILEVMFQQLELFGQEGKRQSFIQGKFTIKRVQLLPVSLAKLLLGTNFIYLKYYQTNISEQPYLIL